MSADAYGKDEAQAGSLQDTQQDLTGANDDSDSGEDDLEWARRLA
jgi:hypothetical protein